MYPLYSGRGTIANSRLFRFLSTWQCPNLTTTIHDGTKIIVNTDDYIGRSIYYFGDLDYKVSWVCKQVLNQGDTAIDIGAHFGLVTLYASSLVGDEGHVHAFEPHPDFLSLIEKSLKLNDRKNVTLHNVALSDTSQSMTLYIPHDNSGRSSLSKPYQTDYEIEIRAHRVSDYLRNLKLSRIRFVKIDVEGHEDRVFAGGQEYFAENPPDVLLFEEHKTPIAEQATYRFVRDLGYDVFSIPKSKFSMHVLNVEHHPHQGSHDYIAIHPNIEDAKDLLGRLNVK